MPAKESKPVHLGSAKDVPVSGYAAAAVNRQVRIINPRDFEPITVERTMSSERSKFSPVRCRVTHVASLLAPEIMWTTVAVGCRVVFTTGVGGGRFDLLRRRRNSKQL